VRDLFGRGVFDCIDDLLESARGEDPEQPALRRSDIPPAVRRISGDSRSSSGRCIENLVAALPATR
jgi:hypothetical protein